MGKPSKKPSQRLGEKTILVLAEVLRLLGFGELIVPDEVAVPPTIDEARSLLDGVGGLMSAGHWGTAAIVFAFVEPSQGKRSDVNFDEKSSKLSLDDFAGLKIRGLSTRDSVRKYRKRWQEAIDDGEAEPTAPGEPSGHVERRVPIATTDSASGAERGTAAPQAFWSGVKGRCGTLSSFGARRCARENLARRSRRSHPPLENWLPLRRGLGEFTRIRVFGVQFAPPETVRGDGSLIQPCTVSPQVT